MLFSTIGLCAIIQLVFSLVASPPPAAADQFFRRSRPHRTIDDGCASFTAKTSCLTGTGECTWHPQSGCVSATVMVQTIDLVSLHGDKGDKNNGDDEVSLRVSRKLKTPATPRPTSPTNNPTTRSPTNKPKSEPSVSRFHASFQFFICLSCIDLNLLPILIHRHPSQHRQRQRRGRPLPNPRRR